MLSAPLPSNEASRLKALDGLGILDTDFEQSYDALCQLAAEICETPIALISLIDRDRQWFKSVVGLDVRETPREQAFCAHAILQEHVFEVPDATQDPRFVDNPLVVNAPSIRFYAGKPLTTSEGFVLGTLCAIDRVPRTLNPHQKRALTILGDQVVTQIELRKAYQKLERLNSDKDRFMSVIAHDLRSPFSGLVGLSELLVETFPTLDTDQLFKSTKLLAQSIRAVAGLTENLLQWALLEQGEMQVHPVVLDLETLLQDVLTPFDNALRAKRITIETRCPPALQVTADCNMVSSGLRNLLSNAIKFSPAEAVIVVSAALDGEFVELCVLDRGKGMDAKTVQALNQGLNAAVTRGTSGEGGTGIGLVLARQFAQKNGGQLLFQSESGQGTCATVRLPRGGQATIPG